MVVPVLITVSGVSDLLTKGSSLPMMIPTAISARVGNLKSNADVRSGLTVRGPAPRRRLRLTATPGPKVANIAFAVVPILAVPAQMVLQSQTRRDV